MATLSVIKMLACILPLSCHDYTQLPQRRVDSFKPGRKIPSRQLKATLSHRQTGPIPERSYLVALHGAKKPINQMIIEIDPFNISTNYI